MGKGDEFKEYKKSKLTSGDIGIRIIGTTENLEFIRNLFGENFRLPLSSQINKLKSKKKYKKYIFMAICLFVYVTLGHR